MTGDPAELEGLFDLKEALLWDLQQVADADGIVLLDGWEKSSGARAELALAAALGKTTYFPGAPDWFWPDAKSVFLSRWSAA